MRRFLHVALENHQDKFDGPPLGDENISMEEEAIMIDEGSQAAAECDQDLKEAERIVEVSNALEDLAVVAGSKEDLTDDEARLMENAGDMAVAGTDIEPDEIVPSMESFRDPETKKISGKLAMENFREKAERLWQNIKRILKEIWEKITQFFYKIFGTIPRRRKALKSLRDKVEATHSMQRDQAKFTVAGSRFMFTGNSAVKTGGAYSNAVKEFVTTGEWVYGQYVTHLKGLAETVAKGLENFDVDKPAEATNMVAEALVREGKNKKVPGQGGYAGNARWTNFEVAKGHDLLGGVSLFSLAPKVTGDHGELAVLDHARQAVIQLAPSNDKASANNQSIEFQTLTQSESLGLIKELETLLDAMEAYQRGKVKGEIESAKKKIADASEKAEKAGEAKRGSEDAGERAAVPHYKALVQFNVALARWIQSPTIEFTKLAFGVINQTEVLINRSCAQYK